MTRTCLLEVNLIYSTYFSSSLFPFLFKRQTFIQIRNGAADYCGELVYPSTE